MCGEVDSADWWLLDSGAAVCVLAVCNLDKHKALEWLEPEDHFTAASGSAVTMTGKAGKARIELPLPVRTSCDREKGSLASQRFTVECYVGNTRRHNILSTTQLANRGWLFTLGFLEMGLVHSRFEVAVQGMVIWAGCPWIRAVSPSASKDLSVLPTNVVSELSTIKRKADGEETCRGEATDAACPIGDHAGVGSFPGQSAVANSAPICPSSESQVEHAKT